MPGLFSFLRILLGPEAFREPVEKRRYLGVFLTCWNSGRDVVAKHGYKWHFRNIEWRVELLRRYVGACECVADVILRDGRREAVGVTCSHRAGFGRPLPCTIEELDGESLIVR